MKTIETEVLVIGSGFGAAAPALRLSEAGFNILMIEKGKFVEPTTDFKQTQDPKYFLEYLKGMSGNNIGFTYAEAFGGGSGFYEMISLRAPSKIFKLKDRSGRKLWTDDISRKDMDPFYDLAEKMLNVEQIPPDRIPKSGIAFSLLMKNLGYSCDVPVMLLKVVWVVDIVSRDAFSVQSNPCTIIICPKHKRKECRLCAALKQNILGQLTVKSKVMKI